MSPHPRRLVWLLAVGVAQVTLAAAAGELCSVPTRVEDGYLSIDNAGVIGTHTNYRGFPVPWTEHREGYIESWAIGAPKVLDPAEFIGWNHALPVILFAAAVCVPPVAAVCVPNLIRQLRG